MGENDQSKLEQLINHVIDNTLGQTRLLFNLGMAQGILNVRNVIASYQKDTITVAEILDGIDRGMSEQDNHIIYDYYMQLKDEK